MNYITQINLFYGCVIDDDRLSAFHVSMYLGLFQLWNKNQFENPLPISRKDVMLVSKIGSTHTYYKILSELHTWGYIEYLPEKNPLKNSLVNMSILQKKRLQDVHPLLRRNSKSKQKINRYSFFNAITKRLHTLFNKDKKGKPQKLVPKTIKTPFLQPDEQDVKLFFTKEQSEETEALRFFNHYTSNGWLVGGKSPMQDWQASARKWISNCTGISRSIPSKNQKLNQNQNQGQGQGQNKKYDEPL
jgi:hypothetical protein